MALNLGLFSAIKLNNSNESILERRQVYICVVWTSKVTAYDISTLCVRTPSLSFVCVCLFLKKKKTLIVSKPSLGLVHNKLNWSIRFHSRSNPCTSRPNRMQQLTSDISYFNIITVTAFLRYKIIFWQIQKEVWTSQLSSLNFLEYNPMSTVNLLVRGQWLVQYMHGHILL